MTDDMLDLLSMILILAIVVAIAFGLIIPLIDTELMGYNENIEDKSITSQYDGLYEEPDMLHRVLTAEELILMTQVQDEGMPLPRAFNVNNTIVPIESTYKLVVRQTGVFIWGELPNKNWSYTVDYDFKGTNSSPWTEAYKIQRYID